MDSVSTLCEVEKCKTKAGLDMTRDPRYYKGHEHCAADLEESKFWRSEAKRIRDIVQRTQFNRNILMWLAA